jgi:DMSO/TMAO reductase YedYZ heme-binding membrane subunit
VTLPLESDDRSRQTDAVRWLVAILLITGAYATMRYNVFENVPWRHWPLYVLNKIVCWSGLLLLARSYTENRFRRLRDRERGRQSARRKFFGLAGFSLVTMHVLMSLLLMSSAYYPKFYDGPKMNLIGELSLLAGVLSLGCFVVPMVTTLPGMHESLGADRWRRTQRIGYLGLAGASVHLLVMGGAGWLTPSRWAGYMPPITLLAFLAAVLPLLLRKLKPAPGTA